MDPGVCRISSFLFAEGRYRPENTVSESLELTTVDQHELCLWQRSSCLATYRPSYWCI